MNRSKLAYKIIFPFLSFLICICLFTNVLYCSVSAADSVDSSVNFGYDSSSHKFFYGDYSTGLTYFLNSTKYSYGWSGSDSDAMIYRLSSNSSTTVGYTGGLFNIRDGYPTNVYFNRLTNHFIIVRNGVSKFEFKVYERTNLPTTVNRSSSGQFFSDRTSQIVNCVQLSTYVDDGFYLTNSFYGGDSFSPLDYNMSVSNYTYNYNFNTGDLYLSYEFLDTDLVLIYSNWDNYGFYEPSVSVPVDKIKDLFYYSQDYVIFKSGSLYKLYFFNSPISVVGNTVIFLSDNPNGNYRAVYDLVGDSWIFNALYLVDGSSYYLGDSVSIYKSSGKVTDSSVLDKNDLANYSDLLDLNIGSYAHNLQPHNYSVVWCSDSLWATQFIVRGREVPKLLDYAFSGYTLYIAHFSVNPETTNVWDPYEDFVIVSTFPFSSGMYYEFPVFNYVSATGNYSQGTRVLYCYTDSVKYVSAFDLLDGILTDVSLTNAILTSFANDNNYTSIAIYDRLGFISDNLYDFFDNYSVPVFDDSNIVSLLSDIDLKLDNSSGDSGSSVDLSGVDSTLSSINTKLGSILGFLIVDDIFDDIFNDDDPIIDVDDVSMSGLYSFLTSTTSLVVSGRVLSDVFSSVDTSGMVEASSYISLFWNDLGPFQALVLIPVSFSIVHLIIRKEGVG